MGRTNVHGRNYGTHIAGQGGRTACKRFQVACVNCVGDSDHEHSTASCKLCQRVGKKRYSVSGVVTISVHTEVEASSPEEAREIALNDRGMMSLCFQCASGEPSKEWVTSGEFDCDVPVPHENDKELEVVELDREAVRRG